MITTQINTQADKKTKRQAKKKINRNRLWSTLTCIFIALIQGNEKSLIKFAAVSAKTWNTVKCLSKIIFIKGIMDIMFTSLFLHSNLKIPRLEMHSKYFVECYSSNSERRYNTDWPCKGWDTTRIKIDVKCNTSLGHHHECSTNKIFLQ